MKKIISLSLVLGGVMPMLAFADAGTGTISSILLYIISLLQWIVPALIVIAIIYFIWGVIQYISSSDEEAKKNGRLKIINGLIGIFVIVAFWGIIAVVKRSFGIGDTSGGSIVPCYPGDQRPECL